MEHKRMEQQPVETDRMINRQSPAPSEINRSPERQSERPLTYSEQQRRFGGAEAAAAAQLGQDIHETALPQGDLDHSFRRDADAAADRQLELEAERTAFLDRKLHEFNNDPRIDATVDHFRRI